MEVAKRAVVIGVNSYMDEAIPELRGAINDAEEVYARLCDPESGGFEIAHEHYLLGEKATFDAVRQAMSDLFWKTDPCQLSLFYFSGHGFRDGYNNGYLAPYDMKRDDPLVRGIRMQELTELVQAARNKKTILVMLDCCYSGIATEGKGGELPVAQQVPFEQWFSGLNDEDRGMGRVILASAGQDQESREQTECLHTLSFGGDTPHTHGAFTFHLLEGLDGKAATLKDDTITLEELRKYIDQQMGDEPDHQPTYYGAGMRQADKIIIARAKSWRNIDGKLERAKEYLTGVAPKDAFLAVREIGDVIKTCARLEKAIRVKQAIDDKLASYQDQATAWLLSRWDLQGRCPDSYDCLRDLVQQLSVDTILEQEPLTGGLLKCLCEVCSQKPGSGEHYITDTTFENQLRAHYSRKMQATNVASPTASPARISSN